jgi:hypothetical protein
MVNTSSKTSFPFTSYKSSTAFYSIWITLRAPTMTKRRANEAHPHQRSAASPFNRAYRPPPLSRIHPTSLRVTNTQSRVTTFPTRHSLTELTLPRIRPPHPRSYEITDAWQTQPTPRPGPYLPQKVHTTHPQSILVHGMRIVIHPPMHLLPHNDTET